MVDDDIDSGINLKVINESIERMIKKNENAMQENQKKVNDIFSKIERLIVDSTKEIAEIKKSSYLNVISMLNEQRKLIENEQKVLFDALHNYRKIK